MYFATLARDVYVCNLVLPTPTLCGFSFHLQTLTVVEDPHVPTNDDLAGFWDMVYIQVEHIYALFKELTKIRENGWKKSSEVRNDLYYRTQAFKQTDFLTNPVARELNHPIFQPSPCPGVGRHTCTKSKLYLLPLISDRRRRLLLPHIAVDADDKQAEAHAQVRHAAEEEDALSRRR